MQLSNSLNLIKQKLTKFASLFLWLVLTVVVVCVLAYAFVPNTAYAQTKNLVIAIDPGHGGTDGGASRNGVTEADANYAIALECKRVLENTGYIDVVLTRGQYEYVGLTERVNRATAAGACAVISLHNNSSTSSSAYGCEVWIQNDSSYLKATTHDVSYVLAESVMEELGSLGLYERGIYERDCTSGDTYPDGSIADYFTVPYASRLAGLPSMIVEHAFVSNSSDAALLKDTAFLKKLGQADAKGISSVYAFAPGEFSLNSNLIQPGQEITFSMSEPKGNASGVTYNFAYKTIDSWSNWNSSIKQTGSTTGSLSQTFTAPTQEGTYLAWVDVVDANGQTLFQYETEFTVVDRDWTYTSNTQAPETAYVGQEVTFSAGISGSDSKDLKVNYVWQYGTDWSYWSSTAKETGTTTNATSSSFTPTKAGTYHVWVNIEDPVTGINVQTSDATIEVVDWTTSKTIAPTTATVGDTIEFSADVNGNKDGLSYNYVWRLGETWSNWNSTVKETGSTTSNTSGSFVPSTAGTYYVWVDVSDSTGKRITTEPAVIEVSESSEVNPDNPGEDDTISATTLAPSSARVGEPVSFSAKVTGMNFEGATYNYVWRYGTGWSYWNSTIRATESATDATSSSFTPTKAGTYELWINVYDANGNTVQTESAYVSVKNGTFDWEVSGVTSTKTTYALGETVDFSANVSGKDVSLLTYNYAWSKGTGWSNWSSTVKATGKATSQTSSSFTPKTAGTYYLWVDVTDPSGKSITTDEFKIIVEEVVYDWSLEGAQATGSNYVGGAWHYLVGDTVTFKPNVSGKDTNLLTYNYVWSEGETWTNWDSTVKKTGSVATDTSASFTPKSAGTYTLWINVYDPTGKTVQSEDITVVVYEEDPINSITTIVAPYTSVVGTSLTFKTNVSSEYEKYFTYNYVWREGDTWDNWNSTVKETGSQTQDTSYTFTPTSVATYALWADVTSPFGTTATISGVHVNVCSSETHPIMGETQTSVAQMVRRYKATGTSYPSSVYASYGASTIEEFCTILYEEATAEGVRAEVLYSQVMLETGWLKFGGDVQPEQCNFGGLGATGGGVSGASFTDVRTGLRAQTQHLKAYASKDPIVNTCVDERYGLVTKGCAPNVEDLGNGKWATSTTYAKNLLTVMNALLKA